MTHALDPFVSNITPSQVHLDYLTDEKVTALAKDTLSLLNVIGVSTAKSTYYNSKEEKEAAEKQFHKAVFETDRGIYGCLMMLPGVTDYSVQKAATAMLANRWKPETKSLLTFDQEKIILNYLIENLPANRMINLFVDFKNMRINNSRTKKQMILKHILTSPKLELWSVKYRRKLKIVLTHAWGKRMTDIISQILVPRGPFDGTLKEASILRENIAKYVHNHQLKDVLNCLSFILNGIGNLPLHITFDDAKHDLTQGKNLPKEVLEGIRSTYHKDVPKEEILKLTARTMTTKQKKLVQKKAKAADIEVEFDPMKYGLVDLYKYGFEMADESTVEERRDLVHAIRVKAERAASLLPFSFEKIGIVLDTSASMAGAQEQKLHPMAIACAIRDVLMHTATANPSESVFIETTDTSGGHFRKPKGATHLATALVDALEKNPDAIFIISDGYENAPAGRVHEVIAALRHIGIDTPIYHINPTIAAESKKGIRTLSDYVPVMPVSNPEALGLTMMTAMLETDPRQGLESIASMALSTIERRQLDAASIS